MTIQGRITDPQGNPLPYANIFISDKGGTLIGNLGSQSDFNGHYVIVAQPSDYITVRYVGFTSDTFKATENPNRKLQTYTSDLPGVEIIARRKKALRNAGISLGVITGLMLVGKLLS